MATVIKDGSLKFVKGHLVLKQLKNRINFLHRPLPDLCLAMTTDASGWDGTYSHAGEINVRPYWSLYLHPGEEWAHWGYIWWNSEGANADIKFWNESGGAEGGNDFRDFIIGTGRWEISGTLGVSMGSGYNGGHGPNPYPWSEDWKWASPVHERTVVMGPCA